MYTILNVMDLSAINGLNIRTPATTTGTHILRIHGRNFPSFAGFAVSTICPMVISVHASTHRATRNSVPTAIALMPSTFV